MPQSFTCLHYHLIFSTKDRNSTITPDLRKRLSEYFGGTLRALDCKLIEAGGTADHVHLLVSISKEKSVSSTLRDLKANSSGWVHKTFPDSADFGWQVGYGAFAVSYSGVEEVRKYIQGQEDHHRKVSFQEEFIAFLKKHDIEFDEKYIWM